MDPTKWMNRRNENNQPENNAHKGRRMAWIVPSLVMDIKLKKIHNNHNNNNTQWWWWSTQTTGQEGQGPESQGAEEGSESLRISLREKKVSLRQLL
jgi:hypothetical protein